MEGPVQKPTTFSPFNMLSSFLSVAALLTPALAVTQAANTTVLGPYGNVPPVYPSRLSPNLTPVFISDLLL